MPIAPTTDRARDPRARVRTNEVQPAARSLLTPRASGVPLGMAPHGRHPQPAQAPQPPPRCRGGLIRPPRPLPELGHRLGADPPTTFPDSHMGERDSERELGASAAITRGCCIKPSRKSCSALAEVSARAAGRDDLAMDGPPATDEMAVFGAHPRNDPAASPGDVPIDVKCGVG